MRHPSPLIRPLFIKMLGYFSIALRNYQKSPTQRSYTELGLSLLLIIIFVFFALRPTFNTVVELRTKLKEGRQANEALDKKIQSLSLAQGNYNRVEGKLELLDETLPKEPKILDFLNHLKRLAQQNEVSLESVTFRGQEETAVEAYITLNFDLSGQGAYAQIKKYLLLIEQLPRFASIKDISLEKKEDALTFSVKGEFYTVAEQSKTAAAESEE